MIALLENNVTYMWSDESPWCMSGYESFAALITLHLIFKLTDERQNHLAKRCGQDL